MKYTKHYKLKKPHSLNNIEKIKYPIYHRIVLMGINISNLLEGLEGTQFTLLKINGEVRMRRIRQHYSEGGPLASEDTPSSTSYIPFGTGADISEMLLPEQMYSFVPSEAVITKEGTALLNGHATPYAYKAATQFGPVILNGNTPVPVSIQINNLSRLESYMPRETVSAAD